MADTTTVMALPFPEGSDANDVPADMQALAERLDEAPGIESLTSAEISGLAAGEKPAGRVVYNSTTQKLQVSNGSTFANIDAAALLLAGGTMAGNIAMGSNKVTGLAAATTNGDAVRYEQALLLAGGTMSGNIAMGGNKVTGLAAASANGDAVRYEQWKPEYAVGVRSSAQSISTSETTVTYTSDTDPLAMLNAGTGVLTVPTAGLWLLSATISADAMGGTLGYFAIRDIGGSTFVAYMSYLAKFYTLTTLVLASASATYDVRTIGSSGPVDVLSARFSAVLVART